MDGHYRSLLFLPGPDSRSLTVATPTKQFFVKEISGLTGVTNTAGDGIVRAPMHGQLLELVVSETDAVVPGQRLAVLEAMKMQHEILAEISGKVSTIAAKARTQIAMDTIIMEIEPYEA